MLQPEGEKTQEELMRRKQAMPPDVYNTFYVAEWPIEWDDIRLQQAWDWLEDHEEEYERNSPR